VKILKNLFLILLLSFMAITLPVVAAEKVILFKNSTTEANWSKFESELLKTGKLSNGKIDTKILAMIAHSHLPVGTMTLDKFTPLWLLQNNLGEEISVTEFRKRAQANEFQMIELVIPSEAPVEVKTQPVPEVVPVVQKSEPPVMTLEEKSVLQKTTADSEAGLKTLQTEIVKLSNQVKASAADKQKLLKLQTDFKNLLEREKYYITQDDVTVMMYDTKDKLAALDTKTTNALLEANTASSLARDVSNDVKQIKSSPFVKWGDKVGFVIGGLLGLLLIGFGLISKGVKANKKAIAGVAAEIITVKEKVETVKQNQQVMTQAVYRYDFNQELVKAEALANLPNGESMILDLTDLNSNALINLKIERTGENQITIYGARRNPQGVTPLVVDSLGKVVSALRRADQQARINEGGWVEPVLHAVG
jgi:hypothetical protein